MHCESGPSSPDTRRHEEISCAGRCVSAVVGLARWMPAQSLGSGGTVKGTVLDPSGAAIAQADVTIANPVSQYSRAAKTDAQGNFEFDNLPANNYRATAIAPGFQGAGQDLNVRSAVPLEVKFTLKLGEATTQVTVTESSDLVETSSSTHTDVDRALFDKLPLESESSSLSSLVTLATPGITADSNGLFHGLGDHASNSFSVDGSRLPTSRARSSRIKFPPSRFSPWR